MAEVRKISVSMSPEVLERVRLAASSTGESVSGWLTSAALRMLDEQSRLEIGRIAADRLVVGYEAEFGAIPQHVHDEIEAFLAGPGPLILPEAGADESLRNAG